MEIAKNRPHRAFRVDAAGSFRGELYVDQRLIFTVCVPHPCGGRRSDSPRRAARVG